MAGRFQDVPYLTFSQWSDMAVVCPECGQAGIVRYNWEENTAYFRCGSCYLQKETAPGAGHGFEVTAQCTETGKYFRLQMPDGKIHGKKIRVKCPYCKESVVGDVSAAPSKCVVFERVCGAEDPYFHYPFYFQACYRGKIIWAFNRGHLQYLIDYLSAEIRTAQHGFYKTYHTMRSQSDMLPAFMKSAKNRDGIVKLLTKLQAK